VVQWVRGLELWW